MSVTVQLLRSLRHLKRHVLLDIGIRIHNQSGSFLRAESFRVEKDVVCAHWNAGENEVAMFVGCHLHLLPPEPYSSS